MSLTKSDIDKLYNGRRLWAGNLSKRTDKDLRATYKVVRDILVKRVKRLQKSGIPVYQLHTYKDGHIRTMKEIREGYQQYVEYKSLAGDPKVRSWERYLVDHLIEIYKDYRNPTTMISGAKKRQKELYDAVRQNPLFAARDNKGKLIVEGQTKRGDPLYKLAFTTKKQWDDFNKFMSYYYNSNSYEDIPSDEIVVLAVNAIENDISADSLFASARNLKGEDYKKKIVKLIRREIKKRRLYDLTDEEAIAAGYLSAEDWKNHDRGRKPPVKM